MMSGVFYNREYSGLPGGNKDHREEHRSVALNV